MASGEQFAFLLPVMMALFGVAFLIVWRYGSKTALSWGCGYLSASAAFSVQFLTGLMPVVAQAILAEILFLTAFFFYGQAVLVHFGKRLQLQHRVGACVLGFAILVYIVAVRRDLQAELLISDLTCSYLLAIPLITVRNSARHGVDRALILVASLVVGEAVVRNIIFILAQSSGTLESFVTSPYAFVMQVTAMVGGLLLALTALAAVTVNVVLHYRDAAERDALTGLLNRRGFERAVGTDRSRPAAVVTCDIDHFKSVNDTFGHAVGDDVLRGVAQMMRTMLGQSTAIARFGGEEFVIHLPDCSHQSAYAIANTIRVAIAEAGWPAGHESLSITASFGVDVMTSNDHSVHDAIARADKALYAAKKAGRNQVLPKPEKQPLTPVLQLVSKKS
ncbi:GGDEF domain-containing protein [Pararhizobium gei]|uniref:GGDEF domain-containing protein n=1 Tax=Pararhizobium gei TaxID=1395951 RepID=UPI0023D9F1D9|nr:GGDEF domain-containing protein [Rhizobium gei]